MKFSVDLEQRNFFLKNQAIEFEQVFSPSEMALLKSGVDQAKGQLVKSKTASPKEIFLACRDLWRQSPAVKKAISSRRLIALIYELVLEKPIRLAFDQLLPGSDLPDEEYESYVDLYDPVLPFEELSAIQPLLCLLLICLDGEGAAPNFEEHDPFPSMPGNAVFLLPRFSIDFKSLLPRKNQTFLLIGYTRFLSQYLMIETDPQRHALKRLGYVFGDRLHDSLHPILLR